MLFQRTSIVGTPLQNASSKTSRHIFLGHHYASHPVPQLSRLTQASRPCLSRQQHNPHWPQIWPGSREVTQASLKTNFHLPISALVAGEETITKVKMPPPW